MTTQRQKKHSFNRDMRPSNLLTDELRKALTIFSKRVQFEFQAELMARKMSSRK